MGDQKRRIINNFHTQIFSMNTSSYTARKMSTLVTMTRAWSDAEETMTGLTLFVVSSWVGMLGVTMTGMERFRAGKRAFFDDTETTTETSPAMFGMVTCSNTNMWSFASNTPGMLLF